MPKTNSGNRRIQLLQPAYDALKDQKLLIRIAGEPVFVSPHTGEQWQGDSYIRHEWAKLLERAGAKYVNPYQTRHTHTPA